MREFNNNHISFWKVNASLTFAILPHLRTISLSGIVLNRTIHHGWTLHWAPEQPASQPARAAWTVSYFADGARILQTKHARYDFTHICFTPNSYALLSCICALHSTYPLTQWDILSGGGPLIFSIGCFAYNINN